MTPEDKKKIAYEQVDLILRRVTNQAYEGAARIVDWYAARGKSPMEMAAAIRSLKDKEEPK